MEPLESSSEATSGNNAHIAAPGSTKRKTRSSHRRTAGELRTYRPPARMALANRSGGMPVGTGGRRTTPSTTRKAKADTAVNPNTTAGADWDNNAPASAGPTALAPFTATPPSAATIRTCSRGTNDWIRAW